MTYHRKYSQGERFATTGELVEAILRGEYVYLAHKITHPGWARSMSLHTLDQFVRYRDTHRAVRNIETAFLEGGP
jgi:hypothetical protein